MITIDLAGFLETPVTYGFLLRVIIGWLILQAFVAFVHSAAKAARERKDER